MKTLTEKQILEWKEELKKQKATKEQAEKVLKQTTEAISMIEGGIQFGEFLLKKNESLDQPTDTMEQDQEPKIKSLKK
mgnify:CR=1 FL=1